MGLVGSGLLHIALAGSLGAFALVAAGILSPGQAREAVDWNVLIVIGAALGLGQAMEASGAAQMVGDHYGRHRPPHKYCHERWRGGCHVSHCPFGSGKPGLAPRALMVSITLAASMAFITPIGYQTNLMVYDPGNYRFLDFARVGGLLQVLLWIVLLVGAPLASPL